MRGISRCMRSRGAAKGDLDGTCTENEKQKQKGSGGAGLRHKTAETSWFQGLRLLSLRVDTGGGRGGRHRVEKTVRGDERCGIWLPDQLVGRPGGTPFLSNGPSSSKERQHPKVTGSLALLTRL